MNYKIRKITDLNGEERTDGRYPLRKGRVIDGEESIIKVGRCAILFYLKDENGEEYTGRYLRTSEVQALNINYETMEIEFETLNSIYSLEVV